LFLPEREIAEVRYIDFYHAEKVRRDESGGLVSKLIHVYGQITEWSFLSSCSSTEEEGSVSYPPTAWF